MKEDVDENIGENKLGQETKNEVVANMAFHSTNIPGPPSEQYPALAVPKTNANGFDNVGGQQDTAEASNLEQNLGHRPLPPGGMG